MVVDPITELAALLEAKENKRAARLANAAASHQESTSPVTPTAAPVAQPPDPAAELFGMFEGRAAKSAAPAPRPAQVRQPVEASRPVQAPRPASPPQLVEAALPINAAQQPAKAAAARRKKVSPAPGPEATRADIGPAEIIRASAHAETAERTAAPKPGKVAGKGSRRKSADLRPLPPALMETPNHDGPTPPLDFIPRPQALRPRIQDIRQDESLDGVQDILARLARQG
jgi:hypothetical protein